MDLLSLTYSLGFCSSVCMSSSLHPSPSTSSFWRLLSQNREERVLRHEAWEEPAPQGGNPKTRYSRVPLPTIQPTLSPPPSDQTPPLCRQRPNRLSCDWPAEPPGRGLASHWLAEEPGPDSGPQTGVALRAEGGTSISGSLELSRNPCPAGLFMKGSSCPLLLFCFLHREA